MDECLAQANRMEKFANPAFGLPRQDGANGQRQADQRGGRGGARTQNSAALPFLAGAVLALLLFLLLSFPVKKVFLTKSPAPIRVFQTESELPPKDHQSPIRSFDQTGETRTMSSEQT